jgi:hypothetical protein
MTDNAEPFELMQRVADFFESHDVAYRVVGSLASMAYGEPRFTNDVDIVAQLTLDKVQSLCEFFAPPEYYLSESAVRSAIARRFQFNLIHSSSGLKVDIIVPKDSEFSRSEASRIRRITSEGHFSAWFASPEDVLLYKLVYYQISGSVSEKHLRDILGMMKLLGPKLDISYIESWAVKLQVDESWKMMIAKLAI